ncbi:YpoC family protein [Bacillus massiliglaciei]|uniref:YpoC family protein n=1 Tax=Bacillus massiliglaciei TaxID=1816693 RepID=UPI000DA5F4DE|nr:hypothetical protein [Bacillus massiliglaciei]
MTISNLEVPYFIFHPFFYEEPSVLLNPALFQEWQNKSLEGYFPYEILYYLERDAYRPWTHVQGHVPELLLQWKQLKEICLQYHKNRQSQKAGNLLKQGTALFISALFWMNRKPVDFADFDNDLVNLTYKPFNANERLQFILKYPNLYPAFIQVGELFLELEKSFSIMEIKRK